MAWSMSALGLGPTRRRRFSLVWALGFVFLFTGGVGLGCQDRSSQRVSAAELGEQAAYDAVYYDLNVTVHPDREWLKGRLSMRAAVIDTLETIVLDLDHRLAVQQVALLSRGTEQTLPAVRRDGGDDLHLALSERRLPGDTLTVRVEYEGSPRVAPNPPWDGGFTWAETPTGAPWIATSVQMDGADLWWPVKSHPSDEPDSMDISITVPDTLVAASNGTLGGAEVASDSTITYHWAVSAPINTYNVTLNVAPYRRIDTTYASISGVDVPVSFYALPSDSGRAARHLPSLLDHVRFLETTLGPYPFRNEKYGIAQTPFLGMEHQTLIAYGHTFRTGGLGYDAPFDALHFHELAHEWYGNLVTVSDWRDFWLHEGPATYLEALYAEHLDGRPAYRRLIDFYRSQIHGGRPIAYSGPVSPSDAYHRDVYFRGALVLHTLRYVIGEEDLRTVLRRFVYPEGASRERAPPFRHVTTSDFMETAEQVSGRSLETFFRVYLYEDRLPTLNMTRRGDTLRLRWANTSPHTLEVPVPVGVNDSIRRIKMDGGRGQMSVADTADVDVDPDDWILRAE